MDTGPLNVLIYHRVVNMRIKTKRLTLNALTCWQITLNSGTQIGEIHCKGVPVNGEVEIGYGISNEKYHNRGYMKEALKAFCDNVLSQGDITCIKAITLPDNFASQSVLTACGFVQSGKENHGLVWRLTRSTPQS